MGFSGGKAIRGPQCSGMLLGRKDLIEAAVPAGSPYASIGRNMKVGKEEMVGLLVAVERYLKADHGAVQRELESRRGRNAQEARHDRGIIYRAALPAESPIACRTCWFRGTNRRFVYQPVT